MPDNEGDTGAAAGAATAGFTCLHFNTQYPAAAGKIATLVHSTATVEAQMEQTNNLYDFNSMMTTDLSQQFYTYQRHPASAWYPHLAMEQQALAEPLLLQTRF